MCIPHFKSYWNSTRVSLNRFVDNKETSCYPSSILVLLLPSWTRWIQYSPVSIQSLLIVSWATCAPHVASDALLQRHLVVVYDSVIRFWPPWTPPLSNAPLRDGWCAVTALASREGSLHQRGLRSAKIGFSFARCVSFTCSADTAVSIVHAYW